MADFIEICAADDLAVNEPLRITVDGVAVALVKADDGEIYAIGDLCSHGDISLAEGFVEGCTLECWAHGSKFDLKTGKPTGLPAWEPVPVFETKVTDGTLYLNPEGKFAED